MLIPHALSPKSAPPARSASRHAPRDRARGVGWRGWLVGLVTLAWSWAAQAQNISTVAGTGTSGFNGDYRPAVAAQLEYPAGAAVDNSGNLFVVDNHRIRKITPGGTISTFAGNGTSGFSGDNGAAVAAQLSHPSAVAMDRAGNLYIADSNNNRIRKVTPGGTISTIAGNGTPGFGGDNGPAIGAQFNALSSVAVDGDDNLYIADTNNNRVRKLTPGGTITTVAGGDIQGFGGDGGPATSARMALPQGVAVDRSGNLFIADTQNSRIRKVATDGTISTIAGNGTQGLGGDGAAATSAELQRPAGLATDASGKLYVTDNQNHRIRLVADGLISLFAGSEAGFSGDNGPATSAQLAYPRNMAVDSSGNLFVADSSNYRVRKITALLPGAPTTVTATAGNTEAQVVWTAPLPTASPAASYTATASNGGGTCTVPAGTTTCTITGLTNGTAYTFTVVMTDEARATSAPSAPSNSVTPRAHTVQAVPTLSQWALLVLALLLGLAGTHLRRRV